MDLHTVAVALLALITINTKMMLPFGHVQDQHKCQRLTKSGMLEIRCYQMSLREVPQNLKSSVEILDLSYNRIKKLRQNSFERYTSIKILVLYDNKIQSVEPGTFAPLTSLEEIDLSFNTLTSIPLEIFQLPSLRNLYFDGNELFNLERDLKALETPIEAPLEYLNIADCGLKKLPDFGVLPKLWHMNASLNPLTDFSVNSLANMCNLKTVDLQKTEISNCGRQQVNRYLRYINGSSHFVPIFTGKLDNNNCPDPYNQTVNSTRYHSCKIEAVRVKAPSWLWWVIAAAVALAVLAFVRWFWQRHSKKTYVLPPKEQASTPLALDNKNAPSKFSCTTLDVL
ncbi:relaxin receptor 1 [Zeugodacus cucurbitae]|uniref:relaxin receptor 1 n=1 Tax=Zeugodacus cucurbitae TaxID=28588 RepID=UPI0023D922EB|nr:relaxin receptor 1 [Zeugodacus cucurbitae]